MAFHVFGVDAVVADLRIGHGDDLATIAGIGEDFLVAGHRGVETDLAVDLAEGAEGRSGEDRAVFQGEFCRSVAHGFSLRESLKSVAVGPIAVVTAVGLRTRQTSRSAESGQPQVRVLVPASRNPHFYAHRPYLDSNASLGRGRGSSPAKLYPLPTHAPVSRALMCGTAALGCANLPTPAEGGCATWDYCVMHQSMLDRATHAHSGSDQADAVERDGESARWRPGWS